MVSSVFPSAWYSNSQHLLSISSIIILLCLFVFASMFRRRRGSMPGCTSSSGAGEESSNNESDVPAYSGWEYDVFLSFRGPDVREHFIDYLYEDLIEARISTFRDDDELRVGQEIGPSLFRAIERSNIFVPIFSKDYASSKWCLQELAYMIDSMREKQVILPVFYQMPPNDVRHQSGLYKQAFHEHKKRGISEDMIRKWKEALNDVGKLKGLVLENDAKGHKGKLKNLVIERVLNLLKEPSVVVTDSFVGVDDQAEKIMELLDAKTNHVQIVGLYGMGGIGKTTIAKFIYNQLFHEFECCSFLSDIRESSHTQGLAYLQKQLISDMLKRKFQDFYSVDDGSKIIREEFRHKKVLIVLDDVSERNHIDKLVGSTDWFGTGSRVIITARDKDLLNVPQVSNTHEVKGLDLDKSLQLFCNHAFNTDPPLRYREVANAIVSTTGGLPLALEVIGSFLYSKEIDVWKGTLEQLKESPHDIVRGSLMISYENLNEKQKQIFLDIACLYVGYHKNLVSYMWEACNLFPQYNILILINKCFVKIDKNSQVRMHDQLRDFGREVVRKENFANPGKRSRVWEYKDVIDILKRDKGTDKVEALTCGINRADAAGRIKSAKSLSLSDREFKNLVNLRFFQMHSADFNGDFKDQFSELRWLDLRQCIFRASLSNFCPASLVILELHGTNVTDNWEGWSILQEAWNLKVLYVDNCFNLRRSPIFPKDTSLERLSFAGCKNMVEIDSSIENLQQLVYMALDFCSRLEKLPSQLCSLQNLETLEVDGINVTELPESFGSLHHLQNLSLKNCPSLRELPASIGCLHELQNLNIERCNSLSKLPSSFGSLRALQSFSLTECSSLRVLESVAEQHKLQVLNLNYCHSLERLSESMGNLKSLTELQLQGTKVKRLPDSIGNLKNIKVLKLRNSAVLVFPNDLWKLGKLEVLDASDCRNLKGEIPDDIEKLSNLRVLNLESTKIHSISESICSLSYLHDLNLTAVRLESLPDLPSSLRSLYASYLPSAKFLYLLKLTNLKSLSLDHVYEVRSGEVRISSDILKLSKLETVCLRCFDTSTLPQEIGSLPRLQKLSMRHFDNVKRLPSLASSLIELEVHDFKLLDILGDLSNLKNLSRLSVSKCPSLETIQGLSSLASMRDLSLLNCPGLVTLDGLERLTLLRFLDISWCTSIEGLPDLSNLKNLDQIMKGGCREFEIHGIDRDVCNTDSEWEAEDAETEDDETEDAETEDDETEDDEAEDEEVEDYEAEDSDVEEDETEEDGTEDGM